MSEQTHLIDGQWWRGHGEPFASRNPASGEVIWQGCAATAVDVAAAVTAARAASYDWANRELGERIALLRRFGEQVAGAKETLALVIARESGKPLWESRTEVAAIVAKIDISIRAQLQRSGQYESDISGGRVVTRHRPHGVLAVIGPFNFPGHLPHSHIIPALLAGNTLVFKPSQHGAMTGEEIARLWQQAGLPDGVFNLLQGGPETGQALVAADVDGVLFTGSTATGEAIHRQFGGCPDKLLVLEMSGNNPLIVERLADREALLHGLLLSSFISAGQRCNCARRLLLPSGRWGDELLTELIGASAQLRIGDAEAEPQPFMGPLISVAAAARLAAAQQQLADLGGRVLLPLRQLAAGTGFVSPGIIDMTGRQALDQEFFGPLLQVYRYDSFDEALALANATRFGLSAGLYSDNRDHYQQFYRQARAGIINWNRPLTGASSSAPFGGVGASGNFRPSAYYATDYCGYPVASMERPVPVLPPQLEPGLSLNLELTP